MIKTIVLAFVGAGILAFLLKNMISFIFSVIEDNRESKESSSINIGIGLLAELVLSLIMFLY